MTNKKKKGVKKKVTAINVIYTMVNKIRLWLYKIWSCLGNSSNQIQAIMIIVLVVITIWYAISTSRMANIMFDDFEANNRPFVFVDKIIDYDDNSGDIIFHLMNIGKLPAKIESTETILMDYDKERILSKGEYTLVIYPNQDNIRMITKLKKAEMYNNILSSKYFIIHQKIYYSTFNSKKKNRYFYEVKWNMTQNDEGIMSGSFYYSNAN